MKPLKIVPAIAALAITIPCISTAQTTPAPDPSAPPVQNQSMAPDQTAASSAAAAGVNTSTGPIPADQMPAGQAQALASGDNQVLTNGPVPDTAANRAKYGGPMSNAGRHTRPIGN